MIRYANAAAFKQALETRLRTASNTGTDFARRRQLLVFDRFLARLVEVLGDSVTLKGGLVVELRVERARTTKDVDLRVVGSPTDLLDKLRRGAGLEVGDFMRFTVVRDVEHPAITNEGMAYEGQRYRVVCQLAGKPYGQPFGVDVAFGDPMVGEPDVVVAEDILSFAGIAPPTLRIYPLETHVAEKLHAYTLPRKRPNSRVKDLPDIALLAGVREIDGLQLCRAITETFASRRTHDIPGSLPAPPPGWAAPYARTAAEDELPWRDLASLLERVEAFLNPVLEGDAVGIWTPPTWSWKRTEDRARPSTRRRS